MKDVILVAGRSGQVAQSLANFKNTDFQFMALGRPELDLSNPSSVERAINSHRPAAIVNAAAYTAVDKAESEPEQAFAINRDGAAELAKASARHGLPIVHISTDYVFSGDKSSPYVETDATGPLRVYGRSKLGEMVLNAAWRVCEFLSCAVFADAGPFSWLRPNSVCRDVDFEDCQCRSRSCWPTAMVVRAVAT